MTAMRHLISGSDAAEDDDIPQCGRCGALVHEPCATDEKAQTCELPDFCFPNGRLVNGQNETVANLRAFSSNPIAPHIMSWQQKTMTEAADEIERLREAMEEILKEVGTSTKTNKIASAALRRS